jgi:hypothetical protein
MGDPILPDRNRGLTLEEIAALTDAKTPDQTVGALVIHGVAALELAGPNDISFGDGLGDPVTVAVTQAGARLFRSRMRCILTRRVRLRYLRSRARPAVRPFTRPPALSQMSPSTHLP